MSLFLVAETSRIFFIWNKKYTNNLCLEKRDIGIAAGLQLMHRSCRCWDSHTVPPKFRNLLCIVQKIPSNSNSCNHMSTQSDVFYACSEQWWSEFRFDSSNGRYVFIPSFSILFLVYNLLFFSSFKFRTSHESKGGKDQKEQNNKGKKQDKAYTCLVYLKRSNQYSIESSLELQI
jgi:hypothetical protein